MAVTNLKNLVAKLNPICKRGLEGAAGLCMSRTNYNVEIEHWLLKLLEPDNTDLRRILRQYDADAGKVNRELVRALESTRTGNARAPGPGTTVAKITTAWSVKGNAACAPWSEHHRFLPKIHLPEISYKMPLHTSSLPYVTTIRVER